MLDRTSLTAAGLALCCGSSLLVVPQAATASAPKAAHAAQTAQAPQTAQTAPAKRAARAPAAASARPRKGAVIARIQISRMRLKTEVREGVGEAVLRRGVGHYPRTALPGQEGNTVLLGHRTTWARPFHDLDRVKRGDRIVLRAGGKSYVYKARSSHVIEPTDRRALEPVPFKRRSAPNGAYVTLITCTPKGSDRYRLVVVGKLDRVVRDG